ncbi:MAG: hypothetical protein IJQ56_06245 [Synergistaceae bacterium]|nr:hypothetical protein [Synergistaceae bacterium]
MCGILGYTGDHQASEILLSGLAKLEYRGYDSAGIAVLENGNIKSSRTRADFRLSKQKFKVKTLPAPAG